MDSQHDLRQFLPQGISHDGLAFTKEEAIQRHRGQADAVRQAFNALAASAREQLMRLLESL